MWSSDDIYFMNLAIDEGERANLRNEVPIGAVLVMDDRVIATGYNCPITSNDPTAHAEIVALRSASTWLRNYRLPNSTIYRITSNIINSAIAKDLLTTSKYFNEANTFNRLRFSVFYGKNMFSFFLKLYFY